MSAPETWRIAYHYMLARWNWRVLGGMALPRFQHALALTAVRYAYEHSPFYRAHWAGCDLSAWWSLPEVNKSLMMEHFDDFNTRGVRKDEAMRVALRAETSRNFRPTIDGLTVGLSSGTSGHRGLFLVSPAEQAGWAGTILARALPGMRRGGFKVALFLRSNSNLYERTNSRLVRFRYFDLMTPLTEAVGALNQFQPDIVLAPPSLLRILAAEREAGRLVCRPERLVSVAEVLEPQDADELARIFGVPIQQIYQCTEGLLAVSCAHDSLHIQEDLVALQMEPLDNEGKRVTPILTDLHRKTQPIIRYRLDDALVMDENPCACGSDFRVIKSIEGRADDVCYFELKNGSLRPFFPDTLRRAVLLASDGIADYRIYQLPDRSLRIHLATRAKGDFDQVSRAVACSLAATIAQYDCKPAHVVMERGIPLEPAGAKRRRVRRLV